MHRQWTVQSVACTSTATLGKASGVVGPLPAETIAPGHDRSKRYKSSSSQQRVLAARPTRHQFSNISEPYEHSRIYSVSTLNTWLVQLDAIRECLRDDPFNASEKTQDHPQCLCTAWSGRFPQCEWWWSHATFGVEVLICFLHISIQFGLCIVLNWNKSSFLWVPQHHHWGPLSWVCGVLLATTIWSPVSLCVAWPV